MRISDWSSDVCSSDLSDPAHNSRRRDPIGCRNTTLRGALDGRTPRAVHGGESGKGRPARPAGACMNVGGGIAEPGPPPIREITMAAAHHTLPLPSGETVPVLGQGTWGMGEGRNSREADADAPRRGLDPALTPIAPAETSGTR